MTDIITSVRLKQALAWWYLSQFGGNLLYFVLVGINLIEGSLMIFVVLNIVLFLQIPILKQFKETYILCDNHFLIRREYMLFGVDIVNFSFDTVTQIERNFVLERKNDKLTVILSEEFDFTLLTIKNRVDKVLFESENLDDKSFILLRDTFDKLSGKTE